MSPTVSWESYRNRFAMFCGEHPEVTKLETVLLIEIDNKLNFESHMKTFCIKSLKKLVHCKESQIF